MDEFELMMEKANNYKQSQEKQPQYESEDKEESYSDSEMTIE